MPPTIQDDVRETIKVGMGQSISIDCRAAGFPVPVIRWEKNFQPVSVNGLSMRQVPSGALFINSTRFGDNGEYRCVASNPAGFATRTIILKVQGNEIMKMHVWDLGALIEVFRMNE